jgi:hypothetical protein
MSGMLDTLDARLVQARAGNSVLKTVVTELTCADTLAGKNWCTYPASSRSPAVMEMTMSA